MEKAGMDSVLYIDWLSLSCNGAVCWILDMYVSF